MNGEVRDNVSAGVLEPTMSKVRSLKSAYEAAVSLLRIDDAIQCVPGKLSNWVCIAGLKIKVLIKRRCCRTKRRGRSARALIMMIRVVARL